MISYLNHNEIFNILKDELCPQMKFVIDIELRKL